MTFGFALEYDYLNAYYPAREGFCDHYAVALDFARFLHKNSKQCTDYDGSYGYAYPGLCHESGSFYEQIYRGAYHWLPWCAYVQVDPISRLYDTFGAYEIEQAEELPLKVRKKRNDIYRNRPFAG